MHLLLLPHNLCFCRVTERLTAKEAKHSISRWKRPSIEYNEFSQLHSSYQKKELKQQIRIAAESRHFLLRQKAKYAGEFTMSYMQYIGLILFLLYSQMDRRLLKSYPSKYPNCVLPYVIFWQITIDCVPRLPGKHN